MPIRPTPAEVRFWRHVVRAGPDDCWLWVGAQTASRPGTRIVYGALQIGGRGSPIVRAHRYALILATGEDPGPQYEACHHPIRCRSSLCVNAWGGHLRWGDRLANLQDIIARAAALACGEAEPIS